MAEIAPFRGYRFAVERVGKLDEVVAPPYDVISPEQRGALVERNPLNVVNIDLPDGRPEVRYNHAAAIWRRWMADKIVVRDAVPALYLLEESFTTPLGKPGVRHGFVAALRLEELGRDGVRPHERTFAGPKEDRLRLMRATHANLSQVFALYRDPDHVLEGAWRKVMATHPDVDIEAPDGRRRMWMVTDPGIIEAAQSVLRSSSLTIADGHHRYETAVTFRNEVRMNGSAGEADWLMVYLSSMDDPALTILPTHRLVKLRAGMDSRAALNALSPYFTIEPVMSDHPDRWLSDLLSDIEPGVHRFGLFGREIGWQVVTLGSWDNVAQMIDSDRCDAWRRLDVAVLHEALLSEMLDVPDAVDGKPSITYTPDPARGHAAVRRGAADLLIMLRPTTAVEIASVADAGDTMPQKSTYFYPKLLTGLVMRTLEN